MHTDFARRGDESERELKCKATGSRKSCFELLPRLPLQRKSRHLGALEACVQGGSKLGKGCHNSQDYIRTAGLQSAGNLSVIRVALRKRYV